MSIAAAHARRNRLIGSVPMQPGTTTRVYFCCTAGSCWPSCVLSADASCASRACVIASLRNADLLPL